MRIYLLAIVAGCSHPVIPDQSAEPDAYVVPPCLVPGAYAVDLVLDHSTCPTTIAPDRANPYYCLVASIDPDQRTVAYALDQLQCGASAHVATTWTVDGACYGVEGAYEIGWDDRALDGPELGANSTASTLTMGGTATDEMGAPLSFAAQLDIINTVALAGSLDVTVMSVFAGGTCDAYYNLNASLASSARSSTGPSRRR